MWVSYSSSAYRPRANMTGYMPAHKFVFTFKTCQSMKLTRLGDRFCDWFLGNIARDTPGDRTGGNWKNIFLHGLIIDFPNRCQARDSWTLHVLNIVDGCDGIGGKAGMVGIQCVEHISVLVLYSWICIVSIRVVNCILCVVRVNYWLYASSVLMFIFSSFRGKAHIVINQLHFMSLNRRGKHKLH